MKKIMSKKLNKKNLKSIKGGNETNSVVPEIISPLVPTVEPVLGISQKLEKKGRLPKVVDVDAK